MLRGLLKSEIAVAPLDKAAAKARPRLVPAQSPKRRPKPVRIALLYPESQVESRVQAEALLNEIATHAEDTVGKYVPQSHLERFYGELCKERGWERKHWCVIGSELGKLTDRVLKKRGTKRFMVYKIPRACA